MLDLPPTPPATLTIARGIAKKNGIRYAYIGNVHDHEGGSTSCHQCQTTLIARDWYELTDWNLTPESTCKVCGTPCAGMFEGRPGRWGARRLPIRLQQIP
jgi:pyruvate formate lyase activating enzyme